MKIKRLFEYFLHILWPVNCPVCGRPGVKICNECLHSIFPENISVFKVHDLTVKSIAVYNDELHEVISALNNEELQRVYLASGFIMSEIFSCPDDIDFIIPVPSRFNKAQEIAKGLGQSWGIKVFSGAKLTGDKKSFVLSEKIKGTRVILVNDICITGSILLKLAGACENYGAEVVSAYVCASLNVLWKEDYAFPKNKFAASHNSGNVEENYAYSNDSGNIAIIPKDKITEENYASSDNKFIERNPARKISGQVLLPPEFELVPIVNQVGGLKIYSAALFPDEILRMPDKFELGRQAAEFFGEAEADYLIPVNSHAQEIAKGMSERWGSKIIHPGRNLSGLRISIVDYICSDGEELRKFISECERSGASVACVYAVVYPVEESRDFKLLLTTRKFGSLIVNIAEINSALKPEEYFSVGRQTAKIVGEIEADCLIPVNSSSQEIVDGMCEIFGIEHKNLDEIAGLRIALVSDCSVKLREIRAFASKCESSGAFVMSVYILANSETLRTLNEEAINEVFEAEPVKRTIVGLEIYSAGIYGENMKALIWDLKFYGKKELCEPAGRAMARFFVEPEIDCIIPVPLHINSERNYNQTYEISKGINEIWNVKVLEAVEWSREIPKRVGLSAKERMQITPEDFMITQKISGLRIALIDDVCTTGSTLRALASACERAGAKVVCAFTLASTN